jgi:hypothetical protein
MGLFDSSNTTTTITAPWTGAQPFLKQVMGGAQSAFQNSQGFRPPPFSTFVPYSSQTQGALSGMWNQAQGGNPLSGQSMGALSGILGGATAEKYGDLYQSAGNPAWAQAVQNQSDLLANDIQRQFGSMGRIGSAADTGALAEQLGQFRTNALANEWQQNIANQRGILGDETQAQLGAANAAPGAYESQFLPYQYQAQVGAAFDQENQAQMQAKLQRFQTAQQAPWNRLQAYYGLVGGPAIGNASTQSVQYPSNPVGGALGGALVGGSIGSSLGVGSGLGALGGGLLGLLAGI